MRVYKLVKYIKHVVYTFRLHTSMSIYLLVYILLYSGARYTKHYPIFQFVFCTQEIAFAI